MSGFFEEVKRRKVYRVAVAYIIAAGGIIQIASAVFPAWELPSWSLRLVIVLLLIGFPIALIFAWAFDVTPQGIRVTEPRTSFPSRRRGRRNLFILLAVGVLVSAGADALREGERAAELLPESKDAFGGPMITAARAQIFAWAGEPGKALELIEHLLAVPAGLTVPMLKVDPGWDVLRNDARFQALLEKYGAKT